MSFYLLRHGQTNWNKNGIVQGRYDVPLNDNGREQARKAGESLKDIPIAICYVSPLSRAKETAEIALKGRDIPMVFDNRLVEIAYGEYEGTNWLAEDYQHLRRQIANRFKKGENYFDVAHRAYGFLDEIAPRSLKENILVVCHGGIGRVIKSYFVDEVDNNEFIDGISPNGAVLKFDYVARSVPFVMEIPDRLK